MNMDRDDERCYSNQIITFAGVHHAFMSVTLQIQVRLLTLFLRLCLLLSPPGDSSRWGHVQALDDRHVETTASKTSHPVPTRQVRHRCRHVLESREE